MKDVLLEIGAEEIPARFMPEALKALAAGAQKAFEGAGLSFQKLETFGTPRRLALLVHGLAERAAARTQEFLGPAAQAKDPAGNWTPAAQGFARSQGTTPEKLEVKETDRGTRLSFVRRMEGEDAAALLPTLLPGLVRGLSFPKGMVWEESRFAFARPLRWILALHGVKPVKFPLAGLKSGVTTRGLRFRERRPLAVPAPAKYVSLLRDHCVIVDPVERRRLIEKQILQAVQTVKGRVPLETEGDLLDEVTHLVEHPVAVLGNFNPDFLDLPAEALVTSMKKHQKFFPVFDPSGQRLLPHFVGLRNGLSENQAVVREGYERVLAARLSDASFFFKTDRKRPLPDYGGDLKGISFLSPTLNLADKKDRVAALVSFLCHRLKMDDRTRSAASRIVELSKNDLATGMVGEFPELQGVMGRVYALADGEPPDVARGVEEHYWPLTAEGTLPSAATAALASLADKLDTLAGNFLIGKIPTGSQDPYGLRRASLGVLRILSERGWPLSLPDAIRSALQSLPDVLGDRLKAQKSLEDFFRRRWSALREAKGFRCDETLAVSSLRFDEVPDADKRLEALRAVRRHPDFEPLSTAFKRASNILAQARKKGAAINGEMDADRFSLPAEKSLHERWAAVRDRAERLLCEKNYGSALSALVELRRPVDDFFSGVVVMDPDAGLAANRLALLDRVVDLFRRVADFDKLQDTPTARGGPL